MVVEKEYFFGSINNSKISRVLKDRSSLMEGYPAEVTISNPLFSASARGIGERVGKIPAPLSPIAPAIKEADNLRTNRDRTS